MSNHYDELETRSPEAREGALMARLPGLVRHAAGHAPGWAERLAGVDPESICSRKSLAGLPVLRKSELHALQTARPPFGGLITVPVHELGALYMSPGPLFDPEGRDDDPWRAVRALHAAGIRKGHVLQNCFGYHMTPGAWMVHHAARKMGCAVIPAGIGQTEQQLELIRMFKPDAFVGTPSFLRILIEKARETGADIGNLKRALVGAEALPPSLRQWFIDQGLETVLQWYGTADLGLIAYETEACEGMVLDEELILEIVRPGTDEPVADGEVGEVVVTSFNKVYPLIRFGTGDMSKVMPGPSPCGRTNVRIAGWMGRADQSTKVRGMFVRPEQIEALRKRFPELGRARLVISGEMANDQMCLRAEVESAPADLAEELVAAVRDITKLRADVELVAPGSLPNDGKVIEDARRYD
ncbi:MAG: AMP-binding protein [Burkholderiaceae bacterium]